MTLQVIGAGFGRTGTDSMREALDLLGFGPCHHMREVNASEEQAQQWQALAQGSPIDWEALFQGYNSCVDWPAAHYWRELSEHILTDITEWRCSHPKATFRDIEDEVHARISRLEAQLIQDTAQQSTSRSWSGASRSSDH